MLILTLFSVTSAFATDCTGRNTAHGADAASSAGNIAGQTCGAEPANEVAAGEASAASSFLSSAKWKLRLIADDFQVEDSHTPGAGSGIKGEYDTARGMTLKLVVTAIVDWDQDKLDPDHIPVWFKSDFQAEKEFLALSHTVKLLATLDAAHKRNTVSSIEQSADLMPGMKADYEIAMLELFAKFGAGGYYLEIDDDLPEIYSDCRRDDLANGVLAWFQEYKARLAFAHGFCLSGRYKNFRSTDGESLETRSELKLSSDFAPDKQLALKAKKTWYNLEQFDRSAGDNGLRVLPFDKDAFLPGLPQIRLLNRCPLP